MVVPSLSRFLAKSCDHLPKLLIFLRMGELLPPKRQIFKPISHPLSPDFVTNTLLGLSRPVGRVPESGFDALLHHSLGAAISPWGEEANKLFTSSLRDHLDKLVVFSPITFLNEDGYKIHRIMRCIDLNIVIGKLDRST